MLAYTGIECDGEQCEMAVVFDGTQEPKVFRYNPPQKEYATE